MATTYLYPGVYVEEVAAGSRPLAAASTTTAAILGRAPLINEWVNEPTACNNFEEFCRKFVPEDRATIKDWALVNAVYGFFSNGGSRCYIVNLGSGGLAGDAGKKTGIHSLDSFDEISMVLAPGFADAQSMNALIDHCERLGDRFAILDGPAEFNDVTELTTVAAEQLPAAEGEATPGPGRRQRPGQRGRASSLAAQYVPHLLVRSAFTQQLMTCPPCGHVAGIFARTDTERGVHKAPANAPLRACAGLTRRISESEQGVLNSHNVNCIRQFPARGTLVWGARTLASDDPQWRYVNVRRLFLMIKKSIKVGTQWTVFEANDPILQKSVCRDVSAFLTLLWRDGALLGQSSAEAFFVKCDGENNPPESVDAGRLIVDVGIAPSKPAEFIIFRIGQWTGGGTAEAETPA